MWFATQEGLSRYDGYSFVNYNSNLKEKEHRLLNSDVADIEVSPDAKYLFAITPYGGISIIRLQTGNVIDHIPLSAFNIKGEFTTNRLMFISNKLFITTDQGHLIRFNYVTRTVEKVIFLKTINPLSSAIEAVFTYNGNIWICLPGGELTEYDINLDTPLRKYHLNNTRKNLPLHFNDVKHIGNGVFLFATTHGLKVMSLIKYQEISNTFLLDDQYKTLLDTEFSALCYNSNTVWAAGAHGLFLIDVMKKKANVIFPAKDPDDIEWYKNARRIFQTGNTLWIGSPFGVALIRNINSPFSPYYKSYSGNYLRLSHCFAFSSFNDSLILSCAIDGLYEINIRNGFIRKIYTGTNINYIFRYSKELYLVSQSNKTFLIDKNYRYKDINAIFPELQPVKNDLIISSVNLNDTLLILASDNSRGLYLWNIKRRILDKINTASKPVNLTTNVINRVYLTNDQTKVWVICDNQISIYDPYYETIKHLDLKLPNSGNLLNIIMDVCEANGYYWLAVYGVGIVQLTADYTIKKIYSVNEGLVNTGLYKIFPVGDTSIIASSNNGLILLNVKKGTTRLFNESDGLHFDNFEEFSGYVNNASIYFGGINGFTKIDPSLITKNSKRPVCYITNIDFNFGDSTRSQSNLFVRNIEIPNNVASIRINYTSVNYSSPDKVRFSYRINELSNAWSKPDGQRFLELTGVKPGSYTLQIKASNEDGFESPAIVLSLVFRPQWYQTWWFTTLMILIAVSIVYALYKARINQLKKEQAIRTKLAADLHDDLGSTLNSVKVYANLALMDNSKETHLQKIKQSTQEAISGLRDIIWVMDDKKGSVEHLITRVSQFALPLCEAYHILFSTNIAEEALMHKLNPEEKRNLYMILKEAVNNSIKYANAREVTLSVAVVKGKLAIAVKDDGKGFDNSVTFEGNGLKNMRLRASHIHYNINVQSTKGTAIYLQKH